MIYYYVYEIRPMLLSATGVWEAKALYQEQDFDIASESEAKRRVAHYAKSFPGRAYWYGEYMKG